MIKVKYNRRNCEIFFVCVFLFFFSFFPFFWGGGSSERLKVFRGWISLTIRERRVIHVRHFGRERRRSSLAMFSNVPLYTGHIIVTQSVKICIHQLFANTKRRLEYLTSAMANRNRCKRERERERQRQRVKVKGIYAVGKFWWWR